MNYVSMNNIVTKKERALKKIIEHPTHAQLPKVHKAQDYLYELKKVIFCTKKEISLVTKEKFEEIIREADISTIESEGNYHKIALVSTFPKETFYLVWLHPINQL